MARRLYAAGGSSTARALDDGTQPVCHPLMTLRDLGLAERKGSHNHGTWYLTEKGVKWCEGKIVFVRDGPYPAFFKATWLDSLPQLRLA